MGATTALEPSMPFAGFRQNAKRVIDRLGGREDLSEVTVQHHDIVTLGQPR